MKTTWLIALLLLLVASILLSPHVVHSHRFRNVMVDGAS